MVCRVWVKRVFRDCTVFTEVGMDEAKLIAAVQARPMLYDKNDPNYHNKTYCQQAWEDVADEVECEAEAARKKWVSLRDYFIRRLRLDERCQAGQGTPIRRHWHFFDRMYFLLPHTPYGDKSGNCDFKSDITEQNSMSGDNDTSHPSETSPLPLKCFKKHTVDMDEEKLIVAVQARPMLYDKNDPNYHNKTYCQQAWEDVADEVECEAEAARKKWTSLRDYFIRRLRLEERAKTGQGTAIKRPWHFFDRMCFLLPHTPYGETSGNFDYISDINEQNSMSGDASLPSEHSPLPVKCFKRKYNAVSATDSVISKAMKFGKEPEMEEDEDDDEDLHFFKSLLPTLKNMRTLDRLEFRHEVHGLLLRYVRKAELKQE